MNIRENWRILLLVIIVVLSAIALFAPTGGGNDTGTNNTSVPASTNNSTVASNGSNATNDGPTNLQFGLELSGGTRIRAPLIGLTAENVQFNATNSNQLEQSVATELSLSNQDVSVRSQSQGSGTVEVFDANVSKEELASALQAQGKDVQPDDVRDGVTQQTRETAVNVLDRKIKGSGLSGGDAAITSSATGGQKFIVVEVPNKQPEEVIDLIDERGTVQVVAHFPVENNGTKEYRNVPLFTQDQMQVRAATQQQSGPAVPISLTEPAARNFSHAMRTFGFTSQPGLDNCRFRSQPNDSGYCLYTVTNGKVVNGTITEGQVISGAGMKSGGLPQSMENRNFVQNPQFVISTTNISEAQRISLNMQAGALPAELDIDGGTSTYIQPSLASDLKVFSVVTGFIAMLAVGGMVAFRYREPRVALPMVMTAAAEVFILLGFASAVGLAIDLSHIAGFIAVIGTGVDDLVIIADEILQQGDVSTNRVFRSRFRKAFWVIGAAAATTIIAMLPLAVLSLGDLQGFAFVTIVGVLIGVLITRPAYGNVLRNLIMD